MNVQWSIGYADDFRFGRYILLHFEAQFLDSRLAPTLLWYMNKVAISAGILRTSAGEAWEELDILSVHASLCTC